MRFQCENTDNKNSNFKQKLCKADVRDSGEPSDVSMLTPKVVNTLQVSS